jgi:hypothetical protein
LELNPAPGLCVVSSIGEVQEEDLSFKIAPNPASAYFEIFSSAPKALEMELWDVTGRIILTAIATPGQSRHDIRQLESGFYFVRIPGYPAQKLVVKN